MSKQKFIINFSITLIAFLGLIIGFQTYLQTKAMLPNENFDFATFQKLLPNKDLQEEYSSDKVLVFNAWATWCGPCINEIPQLNKVERDFTMKKSNVEFIAVTTQPDSIVETAFNKNSVPYFFWDRVNDNKELAGFIVRYGKEKGRFGTNQGIPVTLVTKGNKLFYSQIGARDNTMSILDSVIKVALITPVK
jgi:thiol-disulfide isomerase/thioredoxin